MDPKYTKALLQCNLTESDNNTIGSSCEEDDELNALPDSVRSGLHGAIHMGGRSVKEIEEQMSALKKENFNLKLRIYFLEERMGPAFNTDKENIIKENVELNVELSSLKSELQEKTDLLFQASKALDLQDEQYKKNEMEKNIELEQYRSELEEIKSQLNEMKHENESSTTHRSYQSGISEFLSSRAFSIPENHTPAQTVSNKDLNDRIVTLETQLEHEKTTTETYKSLLEERERELTQLHTAMTRLRNEKQVELDEMESKIAEKERQCDALTAKLNDKCELVDELLLQNKELRKRYNASKGDADRARDNCEELKDRVEDLEHKLQTAVEELRKSQDLVVVSSAEAAIGSGPTSLHHSTHSNTSFVFTVAEPTDAARVQAQNANAVPQRNDSPTKHAADVLNASNSTTPSPRITPPSSPSPTTSGLLNGQPSVHSPPVTSTTNLRSLDSIKPSSSKHQQLAQDLIRSEKLDPGERNELLTYLQHQQNKITKLKAEQMKACKVIKCMLDAKQKDAHELEKLRTERRELEKRIHTVESVTSRSTESNTECSQQYQRHHNSPINKESTSNSHDRLSSTNTLSIDSAASPKQETSTYDQQALIDQYKELVASLEEKNKLLVTLVTETRHQMDQLKQQYDEIANKLEQDQSIGNFEEACQSKDEHIHELEEELRKCYADLEVQMSADAPCNLNERQNRNTGKKECDEHVIPQHGLYVQHHEDGDENNKEKLDNDKESIAYLRDQLAKSDQLRLQTSQVCVALCSRLEELAVFLNSLMKQRAALGFLMVDSNRIRQIVDQSLDLSRSFNASLMLNNPEQSLVELSNLSTLLMDQSLILDNSIIDNIGKDKTCNVEIDQQPQTVLSENVLIERLREEIKHLKDELKLRDFEIAQMNAAVDDLSPRSEKRSLNCQKSELNSESETWSEPDRNVSRERIGLNDADLIHAGHNNSAPIYHFDQSTTEDDERSNSMPRLGSHHNKHRTATSNTTLPPQSTTPRLNTKFSMCENKSNDLHSITRSQSTRDALALSGAKITQLEQQMKCSKLSRLVQQLQGQQFVLKNREKLLTTRLAECESLHEEQLDEANRTIEELNERLRTARAEYELLNEHFQENYVAKNEVERHLETINDLRRRLDNAQEQCKTFEAKYLSARTELDNATLQYSEAVLEKTRIAHERAQLEQQVALFKEQERDWAQQLKQAENEAETERVRLQSERNQFECKIVELEQSNSQLHNNLIRIQTKYGFISHDRISTSASCGNSVLSAFVNNECSDCNAELDGQHSRHTTDTDRNSQACTTDVTTQDRLQANSSPDLGIESDQGRFSSLELNNAEQNATTQPQLRRPLLQTLELTKTMGNLLLDVPVPSDLEKEDDDGDENKWCKKRLVDLATENEELKKKFIRTKRALEETMHQLALANQRKKFVEKTICKQIYKTSEVLRTAKANLDSGSETDLVNHKKSTSNE